MENSTEMENRGRGGGHWGRWMGGGVLKEKGGGDVC